MRRVSQMATCSPLTLADRLIPADCYSCWLSNLLPFYLKQKASHAENVLRKLCSFLTPADSLVPDQLLYPSRLFYYRWFSLFCLLYLMRGKVLPLKAYAFDLSVQAGL